MVMHHVFGEPLKYSLLYYKSKPCLWYLGSCHVAPVLVGVWKKYATKTESPLLAKKKILAGKELPPSVKVIDRQS